jgi:2-hydroxy-3-oxopropionate reductase
MIVGITIGGIAEALLLAEKCGANPARVREAIRGGFAESVVLEIHGKRIVERDFVKRAAASVQLKDLLNAIAAAESVGAKLPATQLCADLYGDAVEHGLGELDHSAIYLELERLNA